MSDTPKSFRELAREMRDEARMCREKDYMASSIALDGQAARIEELADEWEQYSQNEYCPASIATLAATLGAKERR